MRITWGVLVTFIINFALVQSVWFVFLFGLFLHYEDTENYKQQLSWKYASLT